MTTSSCVRASCEWRHRCETYFWNPRMPFDVKFEIEKSTGILLERDPQQRSHLVFRGSSSTPPKQYHSELRFEAALPERNLYSLHVEATAPRQWFSEADFRRDAARAFEYWTRDLKTTARPGFLDSASRDLYEERVAATLERESQEANREEDEAPIRAVQQAVLEELRKGKSFRTAHHEGGTRIYFDGRRFVKSTCGEEQSRQVFDSEDQILAFIRSFYDWESRRDAYPHRPPELEVWRFIRKELS
jgi:hypothetical protein